MATFQRNRKYLNKFVFLVTNGFHERPHLKSSKSIKNRKTYDFQKFKKRKKIINPSFVLFLVTKNKIPEKASIKYRFYYSL